MSDAYRYAPQVFLQPDPTAARAVILTPEQGLSSEERWTKETEWLLGGSQPRIAFPADALVLDYGCGIGRIAKQLQQPVIGVDISPTMRAQAEAYVNRPTFSSVSQGMLAEFARSGLRCQGAVAVWVLQHCLDVERDIQLIASVLAAGAPFVVVNRRIRAVPVTDGKGIDWWDDGVDVEDHLRRFFTKGREEPMPTTLCAPGSSIAYWRRTDILISGTF